MKAEHVDGTPQRLEPAAGQRRRAVGGQRAMQHGEIGDQPADVGIGRRLAHGLVRGRQPIERPGGRRQARVDAGDGAPVGLVAPELRGIGRALGQSGQARRRRRPAVRPETARRPADAARRDRTASARLLCSRKAWRSTVLRDEGIAVAVAADPAAHAQERGQLGTGPGRVGRGEQVLEPRIEARQLAQEGVVVIGDGRSPPRRGPSSRVPRRRLVCHSVSTARRSASSPSATSSGVSATRSRSASSSATSISRSIVLLRRTSVGWAVSTGPTRPVAKKSSSWRRVTPACFARASACAIVPSRGAEAAKAWARRAADVVLVLGDVGQVGEEAVGADDLDGVAARQAVQRGLRARAAQCCPRCDGSGWRSGGCARRRRTPPRPAARARCRRGCGRAGGCRRAAGRPSPGPRRD